MDTCLRYLLFVLSKLSTSYNQLEPLEEPSLQKKKKAITRIQVDRNSNPWFVLFTVNGTATAHSVNKKLQGKTLSREYYSKCSGKAQSLDSHDTIYYCSFVPSLSLLSFW